MKIEDYIHLYLGCEVQTPTRRYPPEGGKARKAVGTLMEIDLVINQGAVHFPEKDRHDLVNYPLSELKPVLRPLSAMEEWEQKELYLLVFNKVFSGDNITHRSVGEKDERWVLWSGLERLFIYKDGDVGGDIDLQYLRVPYQKVFRWQLLKRFDVFDMHRAELCVYEEGLKSTKGHG